MYYEKHLTNESNNLLVIQDVTTSCGCTKVSYSKEPVRPGASLELTVTYEAEEKGHFNVFAFSAVEFFPTKDENNFY